MPGGLNQLSAYGKQNILLTENPEINHFKCVYKRHCHFSIEPIEIQFDEEIKFGKKLTCELPKYGDLAGPCFLYMKLPKLDIPSGSTYIGWTNSIGHAIIDYIDIEIGGMLIDRIYGIYMEIWDELTNNKSKREGYNLMIGKYESLVQLETNATEETEYYIPLNFWFTRHPSLYLPLISLKYHSIKLSIKLKSFIECVTYDGNTNPSNVDIKSSSIIIDYVYLEENERDKLINEGQLYLIEQHQFSEKESIKQNKIKHKSELNFNHPIKSLYWVFIETESIDNNDWFNFSRIDDNKNLMNNLEIRFDNKEIFSKRDEKFFRLIQPYKFNTSITNKYIYTHSFSLYPEDNKPSGQINFSRLDTVKLLFTMNSSNPECNLFFFATNYNFLIIKKGMAALAYLN